MKRESVAVVLFLVVWVSLSLACSKGSCKAYCDARCAEVVEEGCVDVCMYQCNGGKDN